jgi:PKD repeat protein
MPSSDEVDIMFDLENPIARCQDISVQLDGTGNASITAANIDNGSTDNCGIVSMSLDIMDFTCADVGEKTVTLTVTDAAGNENTCTATVTVLASEACGFPPCTPVIDVDAAFLASDPHQSDFHAGMKVIADGIIINPEVISFKAGDEVELRPVFEVQQGAVLTIDIEPCVIPTANAEKNQH